MCVMIDWYHYHNVIIIFIFFLVVFVSHTHTHTHTRVIDICKTRCLSGKSAFNKYYHNYKTFYQRLFSPEHITHVHIMTVSAHLATTKLNTTICTPPYTHTHTHTHTTPSTGLVQGERSLAVDYTCIMVIRYNNLLTL